jgi:hypothetical protein
MLRFKQSAEQILGTILSQFHSHAGVLNVTGVRAEPKSYEYEASLSQKIP